MNETSAPGYGYAVLVDAVTLSGISTTATDAVDRTSVIVGAVVGSVVGIIISVVVFFLVWFCICHKSSRLWTVTEKSSVTYTKSTLDYSVSTEKYEESLTNNQNIKSNKSLGTISLKSNGVHKEDNFSDRSMVNENCNSRNIYQNHGVEKNENCDKVPSSQFGIDNACFSREDEKPVVPLITISPSPPSSPAFHLLPSNSTQQISSEMQRQASLVKCNLPDITLNPNSKNTVRRSYRLDRSMASAIAAQRNRESSIFNELQLLPQNNDIVIVYTERTVL